jgi:hypothetical protein
MYEQVEVQLPFHRANQVGDCDDYHFPAECGIVPHPACPASERAK